MKNDINSFVDEKEKSKTDLYILVSFITFIVSAIVFLALVLKS
jgi:hypothetical protein